MNPLRALFLSLSKMPPAVMLLIIIGLALMVTMTVTSTVNNQERFDSSAGMRSTSNPNRKLKQVVYSRTYIPAGTTIENKQVEVLGTDELDVFDDAKGSLTEVVGTVLKRSIPAHAQIRKVDLEAI